MSGVDLVQWLGVQLDEDDRIARSACKYASPEWRLDEEFGESVLWWAPEFHTRYEEDKHWRGQALDGHLAPHVAEHDPARALREIDGRRRTLIRCGEAMLAASPMLVHFAKQTLREMALGFSHRPGFAEAVASLA